MREIRFRVYIWGRMLDVLEVSWENGTRIHPWDKKAANGFGEVYQKVSLNEGELMQYTGLKDSRGKEIYEGDILQHESLTQKEVVEWKNNMWTEEGFMTGYGEWFGTADQYEIIGNIYENPKLLEEKQ